MKAKVRRLSAVKKVKVRRIAAPYLDVPTPSLQAVLRNHASNCLHVRISTRQLYEIMDELARRRESFGTPFRTNEDAWADFVQHYMPKEPGGLIDPTGTLLTPSLRGKDCLGNGEHPGIDCCCDDCECYLTCFPDAHQ